MENNTNNMTAYEQDLHTRGFSLIGGADEAGRGPLAGPVVAAVVVFPVGYYHKDINDSKKVSPKKRAFLSDIIKQSAVCYAIYEADETIIDEINILQATRRAMTQAFLSLNPVPDYLLTDAIDLPDIPTPQTAIIKGDQKSITIAAASILAKVHRDDIMVGLSEKYPVYGFDKHKGYGTKAHIAALKEHGPCPVHRRSFIKNFIQRGL